MSKNTNLSFLTDYITADITNGRIGINNASPTVAFDVSGITKFSSSVTAADLIISDTYLNDPLIKLVTTTSGNVEVQMRTATTTYNAGIGVVTSGYDFGLFTNNTTRMNITSIGAVAIGATAITDPYTATGGGWQTVQFGKGGILGAYRTDNESMTGFNTYVSSPDGANKAIISGVGGSAIRYYSELITFNTISSSGTAQTQNERMRITSVGNVGIGSTTAGAQLTLAQNNANTSAQTYLTFRNLATGYGSWAIWKSGGNDLAFYYGVDTDTPSAGINMKLRYNGITEFQNTVLINTTTSNSYPLEVEVFSDGNLAYFRRQGANTKMFMGGTTAGATAFYIQSNTTNGVYLTAGGTSWTANSDIRLKNIISPIDSAVDKLSTLNPVIFSWKSDDTNKENIGLIAQDVEAVFPQAIDTNEDGFLGVRYVELVPVLVKAIQELKVEIETLKQK